MFEDEGYERQSTVYQSQTASPYSGGYTEPAKPAKPEKQSGGVLRKIALSICLGLCFGLFAGVGFYAVNLATVGLIEGLKAYGNSPIRSFLGPVSLKEFDTMVY